MTQWMSRPLVLPGALALSLAASCTAPEAERFPGGPATTADPARLDLDVRWLADDARAGRRAGTKEAEEAGKWLAVRLAEVGLEPAGEQGYLQEFSVALEPRDGGQSDVVLFDAGNAGVDVRGADEVSPLFCAERGRVEGPLVWCGYGIENPDRGRDDFAGLDLTGAIAFLVRGAPDLPPEAPAAPQPGAADAHAVAAGAHDTSISSRSEGWGGSASIFVKVMNAKRHGAIGVVLAPSPRGEPILRFDAGHGARSGIPGVAVSADAAEILVPGWKERADAPARPAESAGRDGDRRVAVFADVVREKGPAFNVLGRLTGRTRERTVVVGAHYDHLGHGGSGSLAPDAGRQIHNGADDNASGTAAVLEIARLLAGGPKLDCDVLFALWSGEEEGLLGSEHWAQNPTVPIESVTANLNLDMVGRAGNGKLQVLGAGTSPVFAGWMESAGDDSDLDLIVSVSGGALGGSSDHQTFLKRGIPALHLFSGLHADYHKPTDDIERFEAEGTAKVAVLGTDLTRRMTDAGRIAFVEPKVDKERQEQVKGGFRAWFGSIPSYSYDGEGVLIDGTSGGSPAERAGFLKGDILIGVGDVKIVNIYDFTYALNLYKPGDVVLVKFKRDGADQEMRVTLSTRALQ
ncbi:MAG: M28 family peptidase [Planctomycetota bacterium]